MNFLYGNAFHSTQVPIENVHSKRHVRKAMGRTCLERDRGCQCRFSPLTLIQRCENGLLNEVGPIKWPKELR